MGIAWADTDNPVKSVEIDEISPHTKMGATTLEATQEQIPSQSPTNATSKR
jgi:hypothetical protein